MADQKISELTALTGANVADDDAIAIVDTSATETKKIVFSELKNALDTATGFVRITGDTMTGDLNFGDNDKAIFGAGSDLEIYHSGTHSIINETGTGELKIQATNLRLQSASGGENYLTADLNGAVRVYYDDAQKLQTTSTGVDITGTLTSDGLTVDGDGLFDGNNAKVTVKSFQPKLILDDDSASGAGSDKLILQSVSGQSAGDYEFVLNNDQTSSADQTAIKISGNGDISFYEDTGNTAKFFWDASAERLGLGSTTPTSTLTVNGQADFQASGTTVLSIEGGATNAILGAKNSRKLKLQTAAATRFNIDDNGDISFYEDTGTTAKFFWDASAESLGIGTSSPSSYGHSLVVAKDSSGGATYATITNTNANQFLNLGINADVAEITWDNADSLAFGTTAASTDEGQTFEAMRIDSSGNLLVGVTSTSIPGIGNTTNGVSIRSGGNNSIAVSRDGDVAGYFNRNTSDGSIAEFRKDGATVGSIGTKSGSLLIGSTDTYLRVNDPSDTIFPSDSAGLERDNTIDLGKSSSRFKDIYATNGTIQTSDRNEKQDIEELTDAEQRVAVACKGLLRKFRWRDAVEAKGDEARIHFGIIAQDLQAAFAAEGLDAGDYAMFISSTWTDEETGEERTRMGVRYSELLAFIIAAI